MVHVSFRNFQIYAGKTRRGKSTPASCITDSSTFICTANVRQDTEEKRHWRLETAIKKAAAAAFFTRIGIKMLPR
jgi:hypothetical protein